MTTYTPYAMAAWKPCGAWQRVGNIARAMWKGDHHGALSAGARHAAARPGHTLFAR